MTFEFIPQLPGTGRVGTHDRRVIRSHVMRGRNAGRARPPRPPQPLPAPRILERFDCPGCSQDTVGRRVHSCACYKGVLDMRRPIWNDLALVSLPYQVGSDARLSSLIHEYLNCTLAIAASYTDSFAGHAQASPRALGYLSKAYALISKKLSGPEAITSSVIAAVTSLVVYHRIHDSQATGLVHFDGLERIVRMRGGMAALARDSPVIAQKPWRLDIEFALQNGNPLRFGCTDAPHAVQQTSPFLSKGVVASGSCFDNQEFCPRFVSVALEVEAFTRRLDGIDEGCKVDQLQYSQQTLHLIHRILEIIPLNSCDDLGRLDKMLYLGLLALMATLLSDYGTHHNRYDMLAGKLRVTIQLFVPVSIWDEVFGLWVSFLAGISVLRPYDDEWLLPSLEMRCRRLGLTTSGQLTSKVEEFPWIHALHGEPTRRLFEAARRTCGNQLLVPPENVPS